MTTPDPATSAISCTLSATAREGAALEWHELAALASSVEANADGTTSTFAIEHAEQLSDLVARENACCGSWLRADTSISGDIVTLRIASSSAEGVAVIHRMAGLGDS